MVDSSEGNESAGKEVLGGFGEVVNLLEMRFEVWVFPEALYRKKS